MTNEEQRRLEEATQVLANDEVIYLAGPIRHSEDGGSVWREQVSHWYGNEYEFFNPLDQFDGSQEDVEFVPDPLLIEEDSDIEQVPDREVIEWDKRWIRNSDYILVGLEDVKSRGTMMEIMYAFDHGTPVFVWLIDGQSESAWVRYHSKYMSDSLSEVMTAISDW